MLKNKWKFTFYWILFYMQSILKVNQVYYSTMKTYTMGIKKAVYTILMWSINYPDVSLQIFRLPELTDFFNSLF